MKNHFLISDEEKNRIRNLHESYKNNFGTGKVIKEQSSVVNHALNKIKSEFTITPEHIKLVEEGIKCGHKPSAKCKMGTWAQDDECVRESLMAIIGSEGIIACVGKSIGKSVKDMLSGILNEQEKKRIGQTNNVAGEKFHKAAKGITTDERGMVNAIRLLKNKQDYIDFNTWLRTNTEHDFVGWIHSEFSNEEQLVVISPERNWMVSYLESIGVEILRGGKNPYPIDKLYGPNKGD